MICTSSGWYCYIPTSPIVIDTKQEGFHLTDYRHGVKFKFYPAEPPLQLSWTDPAFSNGWLALDRNGNGMIDDATELFGDITPQPASDHPNGFAALGVFDSSAEGGNENGKIDPGDAVFSRLRVWIDRNHNGKSEPEELFTLAQIGIAEIDLKFRLSPYVDAFGNRFRYRGTLKDAGNISKPEKRCTTCS